ncbi:MAG: histidine kinase [Lacisediminihabitans sp.]
MLFRSMTPRQLVFDVALATACFALRTVSGVDNVFMLIVVIAMAIALGLRRANPGLALAMAWAGALLQVGARQTPDPSNIAILAVLFTTAAYGIPVVRWLGLASSGVGALIIAFYLTIPDALSALVCAAQSGKKCTPGAPSSDWLLILVIVFLSALAVLGLSWTLGLLAKTRRKARESSQARAIAERERIDAQRDVVVEQERNRIARDMHDVVAHSLAVVIAQADGARYARAHDPEAVDAALTTIASTARAALGDVRILLGQLRHSQDEAPQPTLADLEGLFAQMRSSGLRVVVMREGDAMPLVAGEELAIYRIVQEALTNALRHGAAAGEVVVKFEWLTDAVSLRVSNQRATSRVEPESAGTPLVEAAAASVGHGVAGMRERAVLWGGSFSAGATGNNGYLVSVTLPLRATTETDS